MSKGKTWRRDSRRRPAVNAVRKKKGAEDFALKFHSQKIQTPSFT